MSYFQMSIVIFAVLLVNVVYNTNAQIVTTIIQPLANGTCGISTGAPIVQQLSRTVSYLGGMYWSDYQNKIAYIDRFGPAFGKYTPSDGHFRYLAITEGKEAIAIVPVKNVTNLKFVIGLDNRLILYVLPNSNTNYSITAYDLITVSNRSEIFMKGKTDNHGRLWYASATPRRHKGRLYKIENLGTPVVMETNLYCGAGMAWTKDYRKFYLVDSDIGIIYKYDFDSTYGTIANRSIIFRMEEHTTFTGKPFDIALDVEGYLWIGLLHGGAVIKYDENNRTILWTIVIPASDVVSIEFGELDKKTLFVGTSKQFLKNKKLQQGAGAMYGISGLGATGISDNEIVIPDKYLNLLD